MIDYKALYDEIAKPTYDGMDDSTIAATINADITTVLQSYKLTKPVLFLQFTFARAVAIMDAFRVKAGTDQLAEEIRLMLDDIAGEGLDLGLQKSQDYLDALVPNVVTQAEADQLKALAQRTRSRAEDFGVMNLTGNHVSEARLLQSRGV